MKFLILTQFFAPEIGASQVRLGYLCRELKAAGHQVEIVTAMPHHPAGRIFPEYRGHFYLRDEWEGITVHRVWLYAAIRPRFGPGPRTAVIAAIVTWALVIPIALLGLIPSAFFGRRLALVWSIDGLVVMVIAIVIGAWLYREGDGAAPAKS